jgi:LemA protein
MYNGLVVLRNRFKNAFAQISVQLQRRYDLIPNLVATAKQYMQFEQDTLTKVIEARNTAVNANKAAGANPANADNIKALAVAETGLTKSLGGFFALSENYPELKANQSMQQLMEELTTTENKISFARQAYNDAVMFYNTACEQFPNSMIAGMFNFSHAELLEVDDEAAKKAVKVSF